MLEKNNDLRQKAYKILERKGKSYSNKFKGDDLEILLHELDVYQAELEAQNIELLEKESALYRLYKENKTLFDNAPIAYIHIDENLKILKYNEKADECLKISQNLSSINSSLFSFLGKNEGNNFLHWISKKSYACNSLEINFHPFGSKELRLYKLDATPYPKKVNNYIISLIDIQKEHDLKIIEENQKKKLEELNQFLNDKVQNQVQELRKKDEILFEQIKQASLNELLSNIAHQWRQPLNVISLLNILLNKNISKGELDIEENLKLLEKSNYNIQKLSDTIDIFSNLFNKNEQEIYFSIYETINLCVNLLNDSTNINVVIKNELEQDYFGYKQKFIHSVLSVLENSKDAFNKNNIENKQIEIEVFKSNNTNNIIITFLDNGGGIDENIIIKVCEPYFTTKFKSEGVGLGLYTTKKTIEETFKGEFFIENRNEGVFVVFSLPTKR